MPTAANGHELNRAARKAAIMAALPGAQFEVIARTRWTQSMVQRLMRQYHAAGELHIIGWSRRAHGGPPVPTFAAGTGVDKPCRIKPDHPNVKARRYYRKLCASGDVQEKLAKKRAQYWADKRQPDPLVAAFFGKPQQKAINER